MLEQMQTAAFQIIAAVGSAKSNYIEAMYLARENKFKEAYELIEEGDKIFNTAHSYHFDLIQKESSGEQLPFSILFMHAEDQLMNTETIKIMTLEIINLREGIEK